MFNAYSNDIDVLSIQGDALTVTNGTTRVVISGALELTKDKRGLKAALALKQARRQRGGRIAGASGSA